MEIETSTTLMIFQPLKDNSVGVGSPLCILLET